MEGTQERRGDSVAPAVAAETYAGFSDRIDRASKRLMEKLGVADPDTVRQTRDLMWKVAKVAAFHPEWFIDVA